MPSNTMRSFFTLVELVVVIIVLALAASIGVSSFRGESASMKLESAASSFRTFCAGARYRAMEAGAVTAVFFDPEKMLFEMREITLDADGVEVATPVSSAEVWRIPDGFSFDTSEMTLDRARELFSDDYGIELFRFHAGGNASGIRTFSYAYKSSSITFSISPLTGLVRVDTDGGKDAITEK